LEQLLEKATKRLGELDLSNNSLTANCLDFIDEFQLRALSLSSNPIGPNSMIRLPAFLDKIPSLKQLSLKDTNIGELQAIGYEANENTSGKDKDN
jgi:hypothetical protein